MAEIRRYLFARHVRGESSAHMIHHKGGRVLRQGRGLAFWFLPMSASIAEVPADDRELPILFHARSQDYQDVTVQAVLTWRVLDAERLASRVDFTLDLTEGVWRHEPLEQVAQLLTQLSQQLAWEYLATADLQSLLAKGVEPIRARITQGLSAEPALEDMGIAVVSVRISGIRPDSAMEKALQTPARESIQMSADEARFQRRAVAVEKERAIAENELNTKVELAKREEELIRQQGQNEQRRVVDEAESLRISNEAEALRRTVAQGSEAEGIRLVEGARNATERERIAIYQDLPPGVLLSLAARELAGNLPDIEHLNLSPDLLGPALQRLMSAGSERLEGEVSSGRGR